MPVPEFQGRLPNHSHYCNTDDNGGGDNEAEDNDDDDDKAILERSEGSDRDKL